MICDVFCSFLIKLCDLIVKEMVYEWLIRKNGFPGLFNCGYLLFKVPFPAAARITPFPAARITPFPAAAKIPLTPATGMQFYAGTRIPCRRWNQ